MSFGSNPFLSSKSIPSNPFGGSADLGVGSSGQSKEPPNPFQTGVTAPKQIFGGPNADKSCFRGGIIQIFSKL